MDFLAFPIEIWYLLQIFIFKEFEEHPLQMNAVVRLEGSIHFLVREVKLTWLLAVSEIGEHDVFIGLEVREGPGVVFILLCHGAVVVDHDLSDIEEIKYFMFVTQAWEGHVLTLLTQNGVT